MHGQIEISSLADYINQIDTITYPEKSYLYRGQENEDWQVNSSAYRRLESNMRLPLIYYVDCGMTILNKSSMRLN